MDPKAFAPDLVVIGGGMGGISTTVRSRRLGAKVVLVEPASLGGT
jgi:pyruvate/2-oxoglutarate dehydrogenase complex dihydrolipoamide dehydrogenase (E3) component